MNSRDRVLCSLAHVLPDRLPVDMLWPRSETLDALKEHFATDDMDSLRRKLGVDIVWVQAPLVFPDFEATVNGEVDCPAVAGRFHFLDRATIVDPWGIVQRIGDDQKYLEWRGGPLVGRESLEGWEPPATQWPTVDAMRRQLESCGGFATFGEIDMPFKIAWHICGYEHFLTQMALAPAFVHALYDKIYAWQTRRALIMAEAGVDVIAVVGDIAGSTGMMFSIPMFEEYDLPRFSRLVADIKAANPSCRVLYHSDGALQAAIPSLIQCGIDILNPIESNCMDPAAVKREYGDKLSFHGAISVQKTIPNGTVREVKDEVYARIRTVGYDGGYIVSNENSFPYNAPLENVLAMYEAVQDFDYSSLRR